MNKTLRELLSQYLGERIVKSEQFAIVTERSEKFSANAITVFFKRLYLKIGFVGCSSHSGRRTFITTAARKISHAGGSIKDVMSLAGHRNLSTTQRYIDQNPEAQQILIKTLYRNL